MGVNFNHTVSTSFKDMEQRRSFTLAHTLFTAGFGEGLLGGSPFGRVAAPDPTDTEGGDFGFLRP